MVNALVLEDGVRIIQPRERGTAGPAGRDVADGVKYRPSRAQIKRLTLKQSIGCWRRWRCWRRCWRYWSRFLSWTAARSGFEIDNDQVGLMEAALVQGVEMGFVDTAQFTSRGWALQLALLGHTFGARDQHCRLTLRVGLTICNAAIDVVH